MNPNWPPTKIHANKRSQPREQMHDAGITCFIARPDGSRLEGVARDISDGGARISGPTGDLKMGDTVELVLVVLGEQKVRYKAQIRHIEPEAQTYGVAFKSKPETVVEGAAHQMRCPACKRVFPGDHRFCAFCGDRLKRW